MYVFSNSSFNFRTKYRVLRLVLGVFTLRRVPRFAILPQTSKTDSEITIKIPAFPTSIVKTRTFSMKRPRPARITLPASPSLLSASQMPSKRITATSSKRTSARSCVPSSTLFPIIHFRPRRTRRRFCALLYARACHWTFSTGSLPILSPSPSN